ncbi:Hypothetical predicted protein [Pelobates cultripes]|uniref:Secreted protein n=1 Tax=Pelobates cultripes TaxID=61616 RepID=A0AAD1RQ12_PELCU|nr:Hypothetical predicted protein [Pelobates cultripes]
MLLKLMPKGVPHCIAKLIFITLSSATTMLAKQWKTQNIPTVPEVAAMPLRDEAAHYAVNGSSKHHLHGTGDPTQGFLCTPPPTETPQVVQAVIAGRHESLE